MPFCLQRVVAEEHAEQVLSEFRALARQYKDGLAVPETKTSLDEYSRKFRKTFPWTAERNSTWLLLKPLWPLPLAAIDDKAVTRWASSVLWTGEGRAPRGSGKASKSYILHAYELLRQIMRQAVVEGTLSALRLSPRPKGIPSQRQARKKRRPLSEAELSAVFEAAEKKGGSLALRFLLSATTGLRPKELISAQISEVWDAAGFCPGAPEGALVIRFPPIKGGHEHLAPIPPGLAKRLQAHIDSLSPEERDTGLLFPIRRPDGSYQKRKKWVNDRTWREVFRAAGIPDDCVFYQLRHTRLSQWSNRTDIGARRAADLVGHADMRTTEDYAARARGLVPAAFEPPVPTDPETDPEKEPPNPENPTPGPGRKNKAENPSSENHAPTEGTPCPPDSPCPQNARTRLDALADRVDAEGAGAIADRLGRELGPECTRFVSELRAELADIGDSGLSGRLEPLCAAISANRAGYLRLVSASDEGADGAERARKGA
ncbi:MAG: tyrosine-type recombinase/integrase [Akkermansiaceae bacterium]|nr:tyrosine-type recombinase/integrase [Akkermansiaceae bacterium]